MFFPEVDNPLSHFGPDTRQFLEFFDRSCVDIDLLAACLLQGLDVPDQKTGKHKANNNSQGQALRHEIFHGYLLSTSLYATSGPKYFYSIFIDL
jgi:hypothetical protein